MPKPIQRKRTRGWKMPENCIYVGRPTIWGNPFEDDEPEFLVELYRILMTCSEDAANFLFSRSQFCYRERVLSRIEELRGKDLACWCPLDKPCHRSVLLELANRPVENSQNAGG